MHYDVSYKGLPREQADTKAIADIKEYLSDKQWDTIMQMVGHPDTTINQLNFAFGFTGVQGYPFHAFCRKYMLEKYRDWMLEEPDSIQTDDQGFNEEKVA